jgi:hypothetical protein
VTDNPFLQDVNAMLGKLTPDDSPFKKGLETLNARGVNSYDSLFSLMRDLDTDTETLLQAYNVMYLLGSKADKRRAVSPLIHALKSDNSELRQKAAWVLGAMKSKRAVPLLMDIVKNQDEDQGVRTFSIIALQDTRDERAIPLLTNMMLDGEENPTLRGNAAEALSFITDERSLPDYIEALTDVSPDVRFWAVYGLINLSNRYDISPALKEIDHIAAFDHVVPQSGYWHIDREAFNALEAIYWKKLITTDKNAYGCWLISPAPEYGTYQQKYRQRTETGYVYLPIPPVNLKVDPVWLAEQLKNLGAELNVRQPKTKTYLLDWKVKFDDEMLIGGLHRDGYGVVVTGKYEVVVRFAEWYREITVTDAPLYLYDWAGGGEELGIEAEV